jgi:energy-coupling factor transporter ATP-binding protein EcfA2
VALVELKGVRFRYAGSDRYALDGASLSAERGEFVLLVGPSGCGKSTLLRVLNGLVPHFYEGDFEGEARVAGLDVGSTPTHVLARHVGMVFQDPENQLFLSSVEREIAFGLENLGLPRAEVRRRVREVLKEFNLESIKDRAPYELSGGQQQKVAIASVMALEPEILALDEPTANLDPLSALEILSLVKRLTSEKGVLALVVEHRLELALKFATRMVVMLDGRIVADGAPRDVLLRTGSIVGYPPVVVTHLLLKRRGLVEGSIPLTSEELARAVIGRWATRYS